MGESAKPVRLMDIARELGVSSATVSTALTGRRNRTFVSRETRDLVVEKAHELGYQMERLRARDPVVKRIAVFFAPYALYNMVLLQVLERLSEDGFETFVRVTDDHAEASRAAQWLHRRGEVDGVIFFGTRNHPREVPVGRFPFVVIGDLPDGVAAWRVGQDNEAGGRLVAEHLWALGHRRIGLVLGVSSTASVKRRCGLETFWQTQGDRIRDEWVIEVPDNQSLDTALPELLDRERRAGRPLTALFCYGEALALRAMQLLWRAGIRVPQEMSVVGFDNSPYTATAIPPLTTVSCPVDQFGPQAIQLLLEQMRNPRQAPVDIKVGVQLVVRESTGPAAI